jgi:hypothetical protein
MSQTTKEVAVELQEHVQEIAAEVVRAFGHGNPMHPTLHNDIENAYFIALASPTFRHAVRCSLTKNGFPSTETPDNG